MRFAKTLILAAVVSLSATSFADAIFSNQKGTLSATGGVLSVASSQLISVSGLPGYNGSAPPSLGSVKFMSGTLSTGSIAGSAVFNSGGSLKITGNTGSGGFVFKGSFSADSWQKSPTANSWTFFGTITNGMLSENHKPFIPIMGAVTTQLTTVSTTGNPFGSNNSGKINLAGGTTTFPRGMATAPEPGTLALFGTGLVAVGMIAKRRGSKSKQMSI